MNPSRVIPFIAAALDEQQRRVVDVAIVANPDPAALRSLPSLRWVHSVWAGVERLLADLQDMPLHIVRLVDPQLAATMAEAVLAWTLYLHRDMPLYASQQKQRVWRSAEYVRPQRKVVSMLGLGALGEAAAKVLLQQGFQVRGWSRTPKTLDGVRCFSGEDGLQAMLIDTDMLVCLLPLTPATQGLLNAQRLAWLPATASLINFARGAIIDDEALRARLDQQLLKHAVLDVFAVEPLPADSWHWAHPSVTVLPHCSGPTDRQAAADIVAANILRYRQDGSLPTGVDRQRGY